MGYLTYEKTDQGYHLHGEGSVIYNIAYDDKSDRQMLDLYLPEKREQAIPLIVFIHGGGFVKGDKSRHLGGVLQGLQRGYAIASVNYRLNNEVIYPGFIKDVCEAIRYLKYHANEYGISADDIVLWGDTHGGYIASMIGIEGGKGLLDHLETRFPDVGLSVKGVVSFYAPIDLYDYYKRQMEQEEFFKVDGKVVDEVSFGNHGKELLAILKDLDPLKYIDGSEPAFYLLHGRKDQSIPQEYSYKFYQILQEHNVPSILDMVEKGIHGIDFYDDKEYNEPIMRFIDERMKS